MTNIVDIALNNCCTYRCSYCVSGAYKAPSMNFKENKIYMHMNSGWSIKPHFLLDFLRRSFAPNETIVQLSGGEPLLHDAIVDLIQELDNRNYKVIVNSNGNQLNTLNKCGIRVDNLPCRWRLSWHPEQRSMEAFKEDIKLLDKHYAIVNYVVHPAKILSREIDWEMRQLEECGYAFTANPFIGEWEGKMYGFDSKEYESYLTSSMENAPAGHGDYSMTTVAPNGMVGMCHGVPNGNIYDGCFSIVQNKKTCFNASGRIQCPLAQACFIFNMM